MPAYLAKPPHGSRLHRADPLARGLAGAWLLTDRAGPTARESARRYPGLDATLGGGAAFVADRVDLSANGHRIEYAPTTPTAAWSALLDLTILTGSADQSAVWGRTYNVAEGYLYYRTGTQSVDYYVGGSFRIATSAGTVPIDTRVRLLLVRVAATATLYRDGVAIGSNTINPGYDMPLAGNQLRVGQSADGGGAARMRVHGLWVWGRALSAAESRAVSADPYRPHRRRRLPVPVRPSGASPPGEGSGSVAAVGVLTGVGSTTRSGAGSVAGVGALVGEGRAVRSGSGSIVSVGTLVGSGVVTRSGSGSAVSVGQLVGTGVTTRRGSGSIEGVGVLVGVGGAPDEDASGSGSIAAVGTLVGVGSTVRAGAGSIVSAGALTGVGRAVRSGLGSVAAVGVLVGVGGAATVNRVEFTLSTVTRTEFVLPARRRLEARP